MGNWYSSDQEKALGAKIATSFEQSKALLHYPEIDSYLARLAQTIASNSDAKFPITISVIDSADSYALTVPGGYQYVTRGLLLQLHNEGELAAALARGIAHTAMCTEARLESRANLAQIATIPLIFSEDSPKSASGAQLAIPLTLLKFRREYESSADYFGIQYLYKSGYDPDCFVHFVETAWPPPAPVTYTGKSFNSFPPTAERLKALEQEIRKILPKRDGQVTNTPEFSSFRERLLNLSPPRPEPIPTPTLHWPAEQHSSQR